MKYPEIIIKIDQELDQDLAWEFYSNPEIGGCNFWEERALKHHKKLLKIGLVKDKKDFLNKYILDFYRINAVEISEAKREIAQNLNEKKEGFFLTVDKIFKKYTWPKNSFIGYLSIFDFCPRFLDSGEFQVFIYDNKNLQLFTIFHEMLHFIFYDFVQKKFSKDFERMDTEKGKLWDLAEVFNAVIQDTDDFIKLHGKIKNIGYPDHKNLILKGKDLWENNPDLNSWIIKMANL
ncbi:hypothetical protein KKC65_02905 [Patescibacteria group bacterium]|nr:hypothetical protein [Patescibacteria group bacterium]